MVIAGGALLSDQELLDCRFAFSGELGGILAAKEFRSHEFFIGDYLVKSEIMVLLG